VFHDGVEAEEGLVVVDDVELEEHRCAVVADLDAGIGDQVHTG
jgi:hypothetical protein